MLNLPLRFALAKASAKSSSKPVSVDTSSTTPTTTTTDAPPITNDSAPANADIRSSPPPQHNNNDGVRYEEHHDAVLNGRTNDSVSFSDDEEGDDTGSVVSGGDLGASLFENKNFLSGVASGTFTKPNFKANFFDDDEEEEDIVAAVPAVPTCGGRKDGRPVACPVRRVARNTPVVDASEAVETTALDDSSAETAAETAKPVANPIVEPVLPQTPSPTIVPVVAGIASSPPPPNNDASVEEDVIMTSPSPVNAHFGLTCVAPPFCGVLFVPVSLGTGIAPAVSAVDGSVTDFPEDPMEIDGPEFTTQVIDSLGDQMDVDLFRPALARELGRLFGVCGRASGFGLRSEREPTRKSCRLDARSVQCGSLLGAASWSTKMAIRRRSRCLASRHKVGSFSRRVSCAGHKKAK